MSDQRTQVGHCKRDSTDVYAGRGSEGRNLNTAKIGASGWLGNPHVTIEAGGDYTLEESIDLFRKDFEAKLRGDPEFREAVKDLTGKTLGCWCQGLEDDGPACHAEVIAEHSDRLAEGDDGE